MVVYVKTMNITSPHICIYEIAGQTFFEKKKKKKKKREKKKTKLQAEKL
jgi:hypothetical protein